MNNDVKFAVLSTQRSGSTWVVDVLNNLDDTKAYGELFLNEERKWDAGATDYLRFVESKFYDSLRPSSVFSYLNGLFNQSGRIGFKLMISQIKKYPEILIYCRLHMVRIIHLIRVNHLDVIISREIKRIKGMSHLLKGNRKITNFKGKMEKGKSFNERTDLMVQLDANTLLNQLKRLQLKVNAFRTLLRFFKFPTLEITYEELVDSSSNFDKMYHFLEVESIGIPKSGLRKIRRGGHSSVIKNYDEIKKLLSDTRFANLIN